MSLAEMKKFPGTVIGVVLAVLFALYLIATAPPRQKAPAGEAVPPQLPIASIPNPECQYNSAELYIIEPKLFQTVFPGALAVRGQATGIFKNSVVIELIAADQKIIERVPAIVQAEYPCLFEHTFATTNLAPGMYTVKAYHTSPQDGRELEAVSVAVKIE